MYTFYVFNINYNNDFPTLMNTNAKVFKENLFPFERHPIPRIFFAFTTISPRFRGEKHRKTIFSTALEF